MPENGRDLPITSPMQFLHRQVKIRIGLYLAIWSSVLALSSFAALAYFNYGHKNITRLGLPISAGVLVFALMALAISEYRTVIKLRYGLAETNAALNNLEIRAGQLDAERGEWYRHSYDLTDRINRLEHVCDYWQQKNSELSRVIEATTEQIDVLTRENKLYSAENNTLSLEIATLKSHLSAQEQKSAADLSSTNVSFSKTLEAKNEEIAVLKGELAKEKSLRKSDKEVVVLHPPASNISNVSSTHTATGSGMQRK